MRTAEGLIQIFRYLRCHSKLFSDLQTLMLGVLLCENTKTPNLVSHNLRKVQDTKTRSKPGLMVVGLKDLGINCGG